MNCQDISEIIYKYCDSEVSSEEYTIISEHLNGCADCRRIFQLTQLENDILREKDDIPSLSPAFTSLVMSSIQSANSLNIKSSFTRFNRKWWLSGLTTVAAVVALFLYLPQLSLNYSNIAPYYNSSIQKQPSPLPSDTATQYDDPPITTQVNLSDSPSPTESINTTSGVPPQIAKSVPDSDVNLNQSLIAAGPAFTAETKLNTAPNVSRSINPESIAPNNTTISLRPLNIPDQLQFVQVNNNENKTIFNYASIDAKESLQITLVPYSEPTFGLMSASDSVPQDPLTLSRDIQIADKKMTVTFSGNLPVEEMTRLANTVQFQDTTNN